MQRIAAALAAIVLIATPVAAQKPDSPGLAVKAASYLGELFPRLSNVVAEEQYVQQTISPNRKRTLLSDYLIVRLQDTGEFASFRDVFQVDGKPARDRDERLQKLFIDSPGTAFEQAQRIARESARHNIWDIGTVNNPYLAMAFIQDKYRSRFRLISPKQDKASGPNVWSVQFQEFVVPTILKGNANRDMPSRGQWWIDATTGRVLKTELLLGADSARFGLSPIQIVVTFKYDEALDLVVPAEMKEWYPDARVTEVRGLATYSRFRRFGVTTDERLKP